MYCQNFSGPIDNCLECSLCSHGYDCYNHKIKPEETQSSERRVSELVMEMLKESVMGNAEEMLLTFQVVALNSTGDYEVVFELIL